MCTPAKEGEKSNQTGGMNVCPVDIAVLRAHGIWKPCEAAGPPVLKRVQWFLEDYGQIQQICFLH